MYKRLCRRRFGVIGLALATAVLTVELPSASADSVVTVSVDPSTVTGHISDLLFGANHRYGLNGSGASDPSTGLTYPSVEDAIKQTHLSMIRYPGGTAANTFHFVRAIGPQDKRTNQVNGKTKDALPVDSTFGPDEYGKLLEDTNATGDLMLNFATTKALDAANFVSYMTGTPGVNPDGGTDWAKTRADNGHQAPYPISFAEVGNEYNLSYEQYWIDGSVVSYANPDCASINKVACLYAFGGTTAFTGQNLVKYDRWQAVNDTDPKPWVSDGTPDQSFYIRYAPVDPTATTIYVNGVAWQRKDSLSGEGKTDTYTLDPKNGKVTFGDGTHGAIPPVGAVLTTDYHAQHQGFVDYYAAIKKVNPGLPVCTSLDTESFFKVMSSSNPYDCVVVHPYVSDPTSYPGTADYSSADDFMGQLMLKAANQGQTLAGYRSMIDEYAGAKASNVSLLLSEYGDQGDTAAFTHSHLWEDEALLTAEQLRTWILSTSTDHIVGANRHTLIDYTFTSPPGNEQLGVSNEDNVLFAGAASATQPAVVEPLALGMQLMAKMAGDDRIKNSVTNNPYKILSTGDELTSLVPLGAKDADGNVLITVINRDPKTDVAATVTAGPSFTRTGSVDSWTLAGSSYQDYNTVESPNKVHIDQATTAEAGTGDFSWTFPAHSITVLELHRS